MTALMFLDTTANGQFRDKPETAKYSDTLHLGVKGSLLGLELLDSVVPNYDIFIAGENHTYMNSNSQLWGKSIKYLYEHAGVRNVMIEYGHASGWLINQYLQTGDTILYKIIRKYVFKDYAESYRDLMEFNRDLPADQKIRLVGIDLERGVYSAVKVLSMQIPKGKVAHDSIDLHIESLLGLAEYQDREMFVVNENDEDVPSSDFFQGETYSVSQTLNLIMANFRNHSQHYENFLDTNYQIFAQTIKGLEDVRRWRSLENMSTTHDYVYRERYIYQRFMEEYKHHGGKYYGQFGRCHATKKIADKNGCNWFRFKSFANRIKQSEDLGLQNKIMTLGVLYESDDYSNDDWKSIQPHVDSIFKYMDENRLKLYNLPLDSGLKHFFRDDFDYVFLNTTKASKDHPYLIDEEAAEIDESFGQGKIAYSIGRINLDMANLNSLYTAVGAEGFSNSFVVHALEINAGTMEIPYLSSQTYLGWLQGVSRDISTSANKTTTSNLSGFIYRSNTYFNALSSVDFVDAMIGGGLGVTVLTLKIDQEISGSAPDLNSGFVGETNKTKYTNPGVTWGVSAILDFDIGSFTLGGTAGYQGDWSNQKWRAKKILNTSPKTSLSGRYYALRLGFNF